MNRATNNLHLNEYQKRELQQHRRSRSPGTPGGERISGSSNVLRYLIKSVIRISTIYKDKKILLNSKLFLHQN